MFLRGLPGAYPKTMQHGVSYVIKQISARGLELPPASLNHDIFQLTIPAAVENLLVLISSRDFFFEYTHDDKGGQDGRIA